MEKTSDLMSMYVFKRVIYFNSDYQSLITKTVQTLKKEIFTKNGCDTLEYIFYKDFFRIFCNNENVIKQFERLLIKQLPDNVLIYPHYTVNPVSFEDIRTFKKHMHLPLGQLIFEAVQVIILFNKIIK